MKNITLVSCLLLLFMLHACSDSNLVLQNNAFAVEIDGEGNVVLVSDKFSGKNYIDLNERSPLLSIGLQGRIYFPNEARLIREKGVIVLTYSEPGLTSTINYEVKDRYINFELTDLSPETRVDYVIWGPFQTNIGKTVGETVGVVRDDDFAIGIQALNLKTLGGYPTNPDDTEPSYDIFASNSLTDVSDSIKVLYRGQTAKITDRGSKLQAYCRDRTSSRIIPVWGHDKYTVPGYQDGEVIGSKIAIFASKPSEALNVIGAIELEEELPHPEINGTWAKISPEATASYLIMSFNMDNFDEALEVTQKAGLRYLYHGGPFETWGHFKLNEESFPENWNSFRTLVEKAERKGVHLGVHTLSNFITTNDPYVTPVPDERLADVGSSVLSGDVDMFSKEIPIADPTFFNQMKNNNLHTVRVGDELIGYESVSLKAPWMLLNCERGRFGTKTSAHSKGDTISKLMDHGYKTFLSNAELSKEIAARIAQFCNTTGIRQISFDGLEGNWASGMGQFGRQLFVKTWYEHLAPELRGKIINDASNPGHYFWHISTRMNWGEPWYAGFRKSQTQYRLMNQDYFDRNLMPNMLGWFSMSGATSVMDAEWLLARAAGFDAGFGLATSHQALRLNGRSDLILEKIRVWEEARMSGAFQDEQKELLKNIDREFTLREEGDNKWELREVIGKVHELINKEKQPGEPTFHSIEFSNDFEKQPLQFLISAKENGVINRVKIEMNNYADIIIPADLRNGNTLSYEGGDYAILYDKNWNVLKNIEVDASKVNVPNGKQHLKIELEGSNGVAASLELKVLGKPVVLTGRPTGQTARRNGS